MRGRQTLRTRHSHCYVVKRTSNRAGGKCSDAKPCVDTNQDKHGDSGGEQSDLWHVTSVTAARATKPHGHSGDPPRGCAGSTRAARDSVCKYRFCREFPHATL